MDPDRERTCLDCADNRGLATYYPSAGVRRWQTFSEQGLDQRIIKRRFHGAVGIWDCKSFNLRLICA